MSAEPTGSGEREGPDAPSVADQSVMNSFPPGNDIKLIYEWDDTVAKATKMPKPPKSRISRRGLLTATAVLSSISGCVGQLGEDRTIGTRDESSSDNWPTLGQNAENTKFNPGGTGVKEEPGVEWTIEVGDISSPPVVAGDSVVLSGIQHLTTCSLAGTIRWQIQYDGLLPEYRTHHYPVVATDELIGSSVRVDDGATQLVAYTHDGDRQWEREVSRSSIPETPFVTYADDTLYVSVPSEGIRAIDPSDGSVHWSKETDGLIVVDPLVTERFILAHTTDDRLSAYERGTGDLVWEFDTLRSEIPRPVVAEDTVYVQYGNDIVGLNIEDGSIAVEIEGRFGGDFAYADDAVIESRDNEIRCYDLRNDDLLWEQEYRDSLSAPAVADGVVYVGGADKQIRGIEATTGEELWSQRLDEEVMRPVVARNRVFVVSDDILYAFGEGES